MTRMVPADQIENLKRDMPKNYKSNPVYSSYYYSFNNTKPPFDNPKVRQALTLAINRDMLVNQITKGDEKPAYSLVPPAAGDYVPQEIQCQTDAGDVPCKSLSQADREALAKKIFAQAGYSQQNPIRIVFNTDENHKKIAIAIAGMWKSVLGLDAELVNKEWKVYLSARETRDYDAYRQVWRADYNDPNTFLILFKSDSGADNTAGYNSKVYDQSMIDGAGSKDPKERMKSLMNAEKQLMADFVISPLYYFVENSLISDKVIDGYKASPMAYHLSKWIDIQE
jgi:oligopeptide transport system substrate-binding protein